MEKSRELIHQPTFQYAKFLKLLYPFSFEMSNQDLLMILTVFLTFKLFVGFGISPITYLLLKKISKENTNATQLIPHAGIFK